MNYHFSPELDRAKLQELYMGEPEMACEVFQAFISETMAVLPGFEQSFRNGELTEFRQLLHKIKPGFLYVGLTSVFEKMSRTEERCKEVNSLAYLENEFNEILNLLNDKMPLIKKELLQLQQYSSKTGEG